MKYHIISISAALLLAGCATAPTPEQYDRIADQLAKINQNLEAINKATEENNRLSKLSVQNTQGMFSATTTNRGDLVALSKITKLPEKPTDEDIKKYITAIKTASIGQNNFSDSDVQTRMLREIGPGHLAVVLPFVDERFYHLDYALPALVGPNDKELVLKNIMLHPKLASIAIKMGWGKEAKEDIFKIFMSENSQYWDLKNNIGQLAETPEDREKIINIYINSNNGADLYGTIKNFPGVDLAKISNQAWEKQRFSDSWNRRLYAVNAASAGNVDALEALIMLFSSNRSMFNNNNDSLTLMRLTGQSLDAAKLTDWIKENKDKLYFDKDKGRFLVKPAEAAKPSEIK